MIPADRHLQIGSVIFDGMDQIDFTGPFEVLARVPNSTLHIGGKTLNPITDTRGLRKQEFVMELLIAGLEQAKAAAAKKGLSLLLNDTIDRKREEAGFSVEPSPNERFWTLHHKGQPLHNESAV